nr:GGDEF domain-containing protein [Litorivivens lipolytica]
MWAAGGLLAVMLFSIAVVSLINFSNTQQKLAQVTQQYQPKMLSAMQLTTHFYQSLTVLGNYMVEQDEANIELYSAKVSDIDQTLDQLITLTKGNDNPEDANQLHRIRSMVDEIKNHNRQMLDLASNVKRNMPAVGIAADWMEPLGIEMNLLLSELSLELTSSDASGRISEMSDSLKYNWAMVVSSLRNFLAFRNDNAIADVNLYLAGVNQHQQALRAELEKSQPFLLDFLDEFSQGLQEYREHLNTVISIHSGPDWRADSKLMRSSITPTLKSLTLELESLVDTQKARIDASNQELAAQIASAEKSIRYSIQIAMLVSAVVILLTLRTRGLISEVKLHKTEKAEAEHKARHDALTRLPNRGFFEENFRGRLENEKYNEGLSLLFIDLDGFKAVNDDVGHDAGDHVLRGTARRLQKLVSRNDMVARLGGDEFVVLINKQETLAQVEKLAGSICEELRKPFPFQGRNLQIGCSIGVLNLTTRDIKNRHVSLDDHFSQLLKRADEAMYQAKRGGKNRYCVYGEPLLKSA